MNFELKKINQKGKEEICLIISPSDNLETEFFNTLFTKSEVVFHTVPNTDQIIIKKKENISD